MNGRISFLSFQSFSRLFQRHINTRTPYRVVGAAFSLFSGQSYFSTCRVLFADGEEVSTVKEESERHENRTVFVSSLGRWATEHSLRGFFSKFGEIDSLSITRTELTKRPRFAHVTYSKPDSVERILQENPVLEGHKLHVQRSKRKFTDGARSCFVQVRNVSAATSREDITEHFSQYGSVVAVDWPGYPLSNTRREFCFVQFSSEEEADAACREEAQALVTSKQIVQVRKSLSKMNYESTDTILLYPSEGATAESLLEYFNKFGKIRSVAANFCFVDINSSAKPLFWLRFEDPSSVLQAVKETHVINGKVVPASRSPPRNASQVLEKKVFVDELPVHAGLEIVWGYFGKFGEVVNCSYIKDPESEKQLNWCIVRFKSAESVNKAVQETQHQIGNKDIRVRRLGWKQVPPVY